MHLWRCALSIEAIAWALNTAPIPRDRRDASSLAIVLVGLANHAGPDGCNAFPSVSTLSGYARLSERSVQYALRSLEELNLIRPSDPDIVAAYVKRADRRPKGWDLAIPNEVQTVRPGQAHGVQTRRGGVQTATRRGAELAPEPSLNRPENRSGASPVCGQCDGRPADPVSARVIWLDADRTQSTPCPRCHPAGGRR
ncbi:helix-turn-helix domain-containing protein [Amycolatopsis sp. A1MSW2902]|uniref:helix-turn-helix domain-containing protein n=1 Tax=Amycolatopsis sp. A1MSW2902 TaxID=687413 RepID=UPI00307CFC2B